MRELLLASTCLVALAAPAAAETTISTTVNGPVRTSTVRSGSADDILVGSGGVVNGNAGGGVVIDSNHKLDNRGTIQIGNTSGAAGVDVAAGVISGISVSGKIVVDEAYTPTDADKDGDLDGPFATGGNRFGIRTHGAFTSNVLIATTGEIVVEGNNSAGIHLGGPLNGTFSTDGKISVLGDNDVGVRLSGVTRNVRLAGTISALGQDSTAVRATGAVSGAMVLQGVITATGYRFTTAPSDPSKLDSDDLLQGGPAVSIEGDVARGIILAVPPKDNSSSDNDEDHDGIEDSKEGSAAIRSYGSAPALRIGTSSSITIGASEGTGTGFGLIVDGVISGDGVYAGIDGNALQVGGLGGAVAIANGIGVAGSISAKSVDRNATAIRLASGVSTAELRSSGTITAISGNADAGVATALDIAAGASLPVLRNSGEIRASTGEKGRATAIIDRSGTLALVENSGMISASGAASASARNTAINLSSNSTGATVRQTAVASGVPAPSISGNIRFGGGDDTLDLADGKLTGNVSFGSGDNRFLLSGDSVASGTLTFGARADSIATSGTSQFSGVVDFGGGADVLTIGGASYFAAQLSNSSGLSISVQKGTFGLVKPASIASLTVSDGGTIVVTLDKTPGASSALQVSGAANFGTGSKLQLKVANVDQAEGHFVVIDAGSLGGGSNLSASTDLLPFLYKGSLAVTGNQVTVDISRKSVSELGLNSSEGAAFDAIYRALGSDNGIGGSFLAIRAEDEFIETLRQMLPDHAGGTFEAVTMGDRTIARSLGEPSAAYEEQPRTSLILNQVAWGSSKSIGETAGYKLGGWGMTGGAEIATGLGTFGGTLAYLWGKNNDEGTDNDVTASQFGIAAHWRLQKGGFLAFARGGYALINFKGTRYFRSDASGELIERTIKGDWNGSLISAAASASQELRAGSFFIRPTAGVEYYRLSEDSYQEKGGGPALDLLVDKRKSDELAVNATLVAGFELGGPRQSEGYIRLEAEAGRRQIVGGSLGNTRARFEDGELFVLEPEDRPGGWVGRLRAMGGDSSFRLAGEVGAEQRDHKVALSARASLVLGF